MTILLMAAAVYGQNSPPPNAYSWEGILERIQQAKHVVLLSVERTDSDLADALVRLGQRGVDVYLLSDTGAPTRQRLERSGAHFIGRFIGPFVLVDESVFAYLRKYDAYVETRSPGLASFYLKRFGLSAEDNGR